MNTLRNKLFVINKPSGPTSFDIVEAFRKATGIRKVGHAGTLDPLAQGVLLLCTDKATRAVEHFMNLSKHYEFEVRLGAETTTLDAEGDVVREVPCPDLAEDAIHEAVHSFVGDYRLTPPAYSALKRKGKRLYQLARAGETPEVESRVVHIYEMEVTQIALPSVFFRITCSRGTYVRSLARDFGAKFGVPAHIGSLTRKAVGDFSLDDAFPSDKLFAKDTSGLNGIPMSEALSFLPGIVVNDACKRSLLDGGLPVERDVVRTIGLASSSPVLRIIDEAGELIAVGNRGSRGCGASRAEDEPSWVDSFRLFVDRRGFNA